MPLYRDFDHERALKRLKKSKIAKKFKTLNNEWIVHYNKKGEFTVTHDHDRNIYYLCDQIDNIHFMCGNCKTPVPSGLILMALKKISDEQ
jgi:hypothetical protein